jgi:nucleotide-binding universal stress UspA family protein
MFNTVIVAFDGTERAIDALVLAEALTASDGELVVCCVHHYETLSARMDPMEPAIDRQAAQECVAKATGLLQRAISVTTVVLAGASTAATLKLVAARRHADLLVLGSSHRGTLGRVLVGSVSQESLHGASCPVAIAPVGLHRKPAGVHLARIAVGYDLLSPPLEALNEAVALASQTGAALELIAIADIASARAGGASAALSYPAIAKARLEAAEASISRALGALPLAIKASGVVRDGRVSEELLKATHSVDLMVLGWRGHGPLRTLLLGSVCDVIVRAAACPVLIVPLSSEAEDGAQREGDRVAGV